MSGKMRLWQLPTVIGPDEMEAAVKEAAAMYADSLRRHYIRDEYNEDGRILRPSSMGKEPFHLFARRFRPDIFDNPEYPAVVEEDIDPLSDASRRQQLFHEGDTWEADFVFHCRRTGITVKKIHPKVNYKDIIKGTGDIILEFDGIDYIVDLKSTSAKHFKSLLTYGLDDVRGYITQLALYSYGTGLPPVLGVYCRDSCSFLTIQVPQDTIDVAIYNVDYFLDKWFNKVNAWEDVFEYFTPPAPRPEKAGNRYTGRYLVPIKLYSDPTRYLLYDIIDDVNARDEWRQYVVDYIYPTKHLDRKPEMPKR